MSVRRDESDAGSASGGNPAGQDLVNEAERQLLRQVASTTALPAGQGAQGNELTLKGPDAAAALLRQVLADGRCRPPTQLLAFAIVLRRFGLFPELARNPATVLRDCLTHIALGALSTASREELLRWDEALDHGLPRKDLLWSLIAEYKPPRVSVLTWEKLRLDLDRLLATTSSTGSTHGGGSPPDRPEVVVITASGSYEDYLLEVEKRLRTVVGGVDLVVLDTSWIAEYYEKGVIDEIANYTPSVIPEAHAKLGRTLNSVLVAAPLVPNFHVLMRHSDFDEQVKAKLHRTTTGQGYKALLEDVQSCLALGDLEHLVTRVDRDMLVSNVTVTRNLKSSEPPLHIPRIPMQLAAGAHAAYTGFAYLTGADGKALVAVGPGRGGHYELTLLHEDELASACRDFLFVVFRFVGRQSLAYDHTYSSWDRKVPGWFDPCCPMEALDLEGTDPHWLPEGQAESGPTVTRRIVQHAASSTTRYLSCAGGYALAVAARSDAKHELAGLVSRVVSQELQHSNRSLPSHATVRPQFGGWRLLEQVLSHEIRRFAAAAIHLRAVDDVHRATTQDISIGDPAEFLRVIGRDLLEIRGSANLAESSRATIEDWAVRQIAPLTNACPEVRRCGDDSQEVGELDRLARAMATSIGGSVAGLCVANGWDLKGWGE